MRFIPILLAFLLSSCFNKFKPPIIVGPGCLAVPITYDYTDYYVGRCGKNKTVIQYTVGYESYRAIWVDGEDSPVYYTKTDGKWAEVLSDEEEPPQIPDGIIVARVVPPV